MQNVVNIDVKAGLGDVTPRASSVPRPENRIIKLLKYKIPLL